ncbi:C40 family peptidase [Dietzia sp. E1]|uniref:C40 family peptidase n=1 Tax=Dietzia TaxID=37914 RepID=UPI000D08FC6A|nr:MULTISPECIES: C40 family peptidase [Dietzia]AVM64985.1 hydrolase [Dietzia sp. oral taxon 368]MBB1022046.1 C40 family peptidase [Dietzia sp. E1]MCT1712281.1 C40 family peptidase [Dietzia cinnamea]
MGAHSIKTSSTGRRVAAAGLLAAGAAVAGSGTASAAPVTVDVPVELRLPGVPAQVTIDVPEGIALPAGLQQAAQAAPAAPVEFATPAPEVSTGQRILDAATTRVGSPYAWGATGPSSFDCSGLTSWAYKEAGISIPRTSQAQIGGGTQVAKSDLQPGDIVAFYSGASHVGIYAGNGQVVHAPYSGTSVSYAPLDSMPFYGATRYY